jgi:hypothetical protein
VIRALACGSITARLAIGVPIFLAGIDQIQERLAGGQWGEHSGNRGFGASAWRAQLRLCSRFRRLQARGVHQSKTCVAIARELAGFIWDVARQVPAAS